MTTTDTELAGTSAGAGVDDVWHIRRDRNSTGYPWVALCGAVRTVNRGKRRAFELSPMERCQVCMEMFTL